MPKIQSQHNGIEYEVYDYSNGKPHYVVTDHLNCDLFLYSKDQADLALDAAIYTEKKTKVDTRVEVIGKE